MMRVRQKKGVLGQRDIPLSRLSIHQSLLQRSISPSRNFGVNCRTKGFAFRNLAEAKTTFYTHVYR